MKRHKSSPGQVPLLATGWQRKGFPRPWSSNQSAAEKKRGKPMKGRAAKGVRNHLAIGYRFIAPDGQRYTVGRNIKHFCERHGLYYRAMLNVWHGRANHHKGWTSARSRDRDKPSTRGNKPYRFISPNGEVFEGCNIQKFAREHNLTPQLLQLVAQGKRNHHKGWRLAL